MALFCRLASLPSALCFIQQSFFTHLSKEERASIARSTQKPEKLQHFSLQPGLICTPFRKWEKRSCLRWKRSLSSKTRPPASSAFTDVSANDFSQSIHCTTLFDTSRGKQAHLLPTHPLLPLLMLASPLLPLACTSTLLLRAPCS